MWNCKTNDSESIVDNPKKERWKKSELELRLTYYIVQFNRHLVRILSQYISKYHLQILEQTEISQRPGDLVLFLRSQEV